MVGDERARARIRDQDPCAGNCISIAYIARCLSLSTRGGNFEIARESEMRTDGRTLGCPSETFRLSVCSRKVRTQDVVPWSVSTLQLCGRSVLGRPSATVVLSKPDILRARLNNFPRKKGEPRNWLLTASTGRVARYEMKVNCVIDPDTIISIVPNATRYIPKSRIPGIPGARQFFFSRFTRLRRESRVSSRYRSSFGRG